MSIRGWLELAQAPLSLPVAAWTWQLAARSEHTGESSTHSEALPALEIDLK